MAIEYVKYLLYVMRTLSLDMFYPFIYKCSTTLRSGLEPPRGDIHLDELYECVTTRINYFLSHYSQDSSISKDGIKFQYLSLGTALDRTGHFMLRLLSAQSESFKQFVISSEATFMIERLEFLKSNQIQQQITTTLRHLNECDNKILMWISEMKYIFTEIKSAFKNSHMTNFNHDENCMLYNIRVPFQMCLNAVANREFLMEKGKAIVPCGKWKIFLKHLFTAHMKNEILNIQSGERVMDTMSDQRLQDLKDIVLNQFVKKSRIGNSATDITADELDSLKGMFPPCMSHLYNNLKQTHRLTHNARFNFSLFLKDVGMSLNESIAFWKTEYSKPSKCAGKCSHSWQSSSSKYVYSVRHLYGLEGRRADYSAPSCSKIQSNNLGPLEEGGCPFLNFDLQQLDNLLDQNIVQANEVYKKIVRLRSQGQPLAACDCYRKAFMKAVGHESCDDNFQHTTPVEYFFILKKHLISYNKD